MKKGPRKQNNSLVEEAYRLLKDIEAGNKQFITETDARMKKIGTDLNNADREIGKIDKKLTSDDKKFVAQMDTIALDFLSED